MWLPPCCCCSRKLLRYKNKNCLSARAALNITLLLLVGHVVLNFQKRHGLGGHGGFVGRSDGQEGRAFGSARAALGTTSSSGAAEHFALVTRRLLAGQLALRLRAQSGSLALPGALSLLAERAAVGLGGSAGGAAHGWAADSLAGGAVFFLAHVLRASDGADGFLAVHFALGTLSRLAVHLALGSGAHRVAFGGTDGIVTQPLALRVALSGGGHGQESNNSEYQIFHD
jgi:hypothetical protein